MRPSHSGKNSIIQIELPGNPGPCLFCGTPWDPADLMFYGPDGVAICPDCVGRVALVFERRIGREWYRTRPG